MGASLFRRRKIAAASLPPTVTAKWSPAVLDEGFVPFPKRLLRTMGRIFDGPSAVEDLAVVLAVADYKRRDLMRPPSLLYLAHNAGIDPERFGERLAVLTERGLLKRKGPDEEIAIDLSPLEALIEKYTPTEDI